MKLSFFSNKNDDRAAANQSLEPSYLGRKKIKVLIVDDEESFVRLAKMSLEKHGGFEVRTETKACQALQAAVNFKPDLALLDVMLPDGDGGQIAAALQDHPELEGLPIIFLTAAIKRDDSGRLTRQIGGRTYIPKPVKVEDLIGCIMDAART